MLYNDVIKIPCKIINTYPEEKIRDMIETIIDHYYDVGFPYYEIDEKKIFSDVNRLKSLDVDSLLLPDNVIQQSMVGLRTVNAFHPEMWSVKCNNARTPMEVFNDRELFYVAIRKRIKYSDTKLADYNIRKSLKIFGAQSVSNFRPSVAKFIYKKYTVAGNSVLDPCMGYGGRLLGALCTEGLEYSGVDPNTVTIENNGKMARKLRGVSYSNPVVTYNMPFEDFDTTQKYDLVFTSPPYFNIEKYSTEHTQSYIKFPDFDSWEEGFLRVLIEHSYDFLNTGGHLVLNVGRLITDSTFDIGTEVFGKKPETYNMRLSKVMGKGNKDKISHKLEPIFAWRKQ